ncbi:RagB/SusD family nutrient uptake outer membrane protein [Chitinophaga varians]|uniref:RagB/SusD family nutrient uptake outer membrane protein n=1 Tax=Chitinophaga varians TaxID=2202339 RepID=A0A847RXX2_9BACT|nr:RagB/SusD family nutrient uptake outer membrane protein [Chitinophaga varians]NLR66844.1 RagB/SusD family nutrient uptake outer membrane protein [Chitinophaga varians]
MKPKSTIYYIAILTIITYTSCKKFLEIPAPVTSINTENVYQYDNTAAAVVTGIYAQMMFNDFNSGGITSISFLQELAADNLVLADINQAEFLNIWRNGLGPDYTSSRSTGNYMTNLYPRIYTINAALDGINKSQSLTMQVKNRLLGELYFLRAFYYFYLVNIFGDIPIVLTTDYTTNSVISRSPSSAVYKQILSDLQSSKSLLDDNYVDGTILTSTTERIRPNRSAALGMLSRVQLYMKNFSEAEAAATEVINKQSTYSLIGLDSVFKKNSKETIWALQPTKTGFNTDEANTFILTSAPGPGSSRIVYASPSLVNSFERDDKRLSKWMGNIASGTQNFPFFAKYKALANSGSITEYCIVLRLSELYLIRSEARMELNNISGSLEDLNIIRSRAGLPTFTTSTKQALRTAIFHERRVELFEEWGHRWFDLTRSGTMDESMQNAEMYKGGVWASYKSFYPIPNSEILRDKNLTQNPGYQN